MPRATNGIYNNLLHILDIFALGLIEKKVVSFLRANFNCKPNRFSFLEHFLLLELGILGMVGVSLLKRCEEFARGTVQHVLFS